MRPEGSVALVTGASSGIGRATATRLAELGAQVLVAGRDRGALEALAASTGARVLVADLSDPVAVQRVAQEALAAAGRIDILINNAGVGWAGPFEGTDPAAIEKLVAVNLLAPIQLTRALLPGMLARSRGRIVNVASIAGHVGVRGEVVYAATKAGLVGFSESLRFELAGTGVGVSLVSPGVVATRFFERRGTPYTRAWPRPIAPERVAEVLVRAIREDRDEVVVPAWLSLPIRLRGSFPGLYRALAKRFG